MVSMQNRTVKATQRICKGGISLEPPVCTYSTHDGGASSISSPTSGQVDHEPDGNEIEDGVDSVEQELLKLTLFVNYEGLPQR